MKPYILISIALLSVLLFVLGGSYHVVSRERRDFKMIKKISWSPNEIFVNVDALENMPMVAVQTQYPLFIALQARLKEERLLNEPKVAP